MATSETKHMYASAVDLLHIRIVNLDWTERHEKEIKHIHVSAADLLHVRIENLDYSGTSINGHLHTSVTS